MQRRKEAWQVFVFAAAGGAVRIRGMKRDSLFFRLFKELPGAFFQMVGRPASDAERFELNAVELKETSVRLDGVFQPRFPAEDPAYLWEAQYYKSDKVYANFLSKIGRYLEHGDPRQDWVAVVIYPDRSTEQDNLHPYRWLIESDQLVRIYLDELPSDEEQPLELAVLGLIAASKKVAKDQAKALVDRVKISDRSETYRRLVIQFIATVVLNRFSDKSREEIETMLGINDIRESRVWQEAVKEGVAIGESRGEERGEEKGFAKGMEHAARKLIERGDSIESIAEVTGLTLAEVRKLKKKTR